MKSVITYEVINSKISNVKLLEVDSILDEIEKNIKEFDLMITQRTTLSTMKGSIHYHLKQNKRPGLLELTYWPLKNRLWIEIHDNRKSEWNLNMIEPFSKRIAKQFSGEIQIIGE